MRNYWSPGLGETPFSIFKKAEAEGAKTHVFTEDDAPQAESSIFSILRPSDQPKKGNLFYSKAEHAEELPAGDPFSGVPRSSERKTFRGRPGGPGGEGWKPYPRIREGYRMPAGLSGPGPSTSLIENPAFWLIAGTGVLIALEVSGIINLSNKA